MHYFARLRLAFVELVSKLIWHVSLVFVRSNLVWMCYKKLAGVDGFFWSRFMMSILWCVRMLLAGLGLWWFYSHEAPRSVLLVAILTIGIVWYLLSILLRWRLYVYRDSIQQFIKDLENARL